VALTFIGLPFVVRTVQPVLEDLSRELEEAAATLGASAADLLQVILPTLAPALLTGFAGLRPRRGRVRLGDLHRRQHADGLGDHAAADHHQARAVRLRRRHRDRGGDAGHRLPLLLLINLIQAWARQRQGR
jgi:sulfate transport system permease protein